MYGGNQHATYDQGWVGWFCQKALEIKSGILKEPFTISGTGKQVRDVLHSDDVVNLYFSAAKNIEKVQGKAFNIGGGIQNSLSLLELFQLLEQWLDIDMKYSKLPFRSSDQKVFIADNNTTSKLLKWTAEINKSNGIEKMIALIKQKKKRDK